jgi:hypothetical protein
MEKKIHKETGFKKIKNTQILKSTGKCNPTSKSLGLRLKGGDRIRLLSRLRKLAEKNEMKLKFRNIIWKTKNTG